MKQLLLSVAYVMSAFFTQAQKDDPIIYDFSKGAFVQNAAYNSAKGKVAPLTYGGFAKFKIININTFRYKVELQGTSVNYMTPIPSELQRVFRLSGENFSDQNLVKALGLTKESATEMEEVEEQTRDVAKAAGSDAETAALKAIQFSDDTVAADDAKAANKIKDAAEKLEKEMQKLVAACEQFVVIAQKVANIKFTRMQLVNLSKQLWKNHGEMLAALPALLTEEQMKANYDLFTVYYAKAYSLYTNALLAAEAADEAKVPGAKSYIKAIKQADEKIEEGHDLFYQDNFIKLIEDVVTLQNALENSANFEVKSAPIQVDGDYVGFTFKIAPVQVNSLMPFETAQEFPIEIPARGGLKVDFGVGPAFSFGDNSRDNIYFFEPTSKKDTSVLKQRPNNNTISPGIAATMHVGPRNGTEWRPALMFGVGAGFQTMQDVNLSMYVGASVVCGKRERVMLSAGWSFLRVERLKDKEYTLDKEYLTSSTSIANVTEKVFKSSGFLSISYNLTNKLVIK